MRSFNGATALRPWTASPGPSAGRRGHASMGPRPCGRGRRRARWRRPRAGRLQWGHGLAAVDGRNRCSGMPPGLSFNGATALRPWTGANPAKIIIAAIASMGPRPCGRGRMYTLGMAFSNIVRLQWGHGLAAVDGGGGVLWLAHGVLLQWGHGLAAVDGATYSARASARTCCFNGATALRPWTVPRGPPADAGQVLQWGHGLAAVDGRQTASRWTLRCRLQWGHGLAAVDGEGRVLTSDAMVPGFNGATALRPWTGRKRRCRP